MKVLKIVLALSVILGLAVVSCQYRGNITEPQAPTTGNSFALPSGVTVDSAFFRVYVLTAANQTVTVHRITSDWGEMTVTFSSFGSAFDPTVLGSFTTDALGWHSVNVTSLVQGWLDGSYPNYGLMLKQDTSPLSSYASSERLATSIRPELEICYSTISGPVCETFQRGFNGSVFDTYVNEGSATTNFGDRDELYTGVLSDLIKYALFKFDLPTVELACIGDFVWFDDNHNGIQDLGEPGVPGVLVRLLDCSGNILDSMYTDSDGIYGFCDLTPGDYNVQFVLPNGFVFSPQDQGSDDAVDSDADMTTGMTICTTLDAGETDLTWDAGIYTPDEHCTRTIGYWKTHDGTGPQADVVTALLPQWLGTAGGLKSIDVTNTTISHAILSIDGTYGPASNGISKLYAQLLGAKLNAANDADISSIASVIAAADAFLATHDWNDWSGLSRADKNMVLGWMMTLDDYNNGLIGPIHCD